MKPIPRNSRPAKVRRTAGGKAKHAADLAWAKAVREKGPCIAKGKTLSALVLWKIGEEEGQSLTFQHQECSPILTAAHIIRRGYMATRTDLDNGVPLCFEAHDFFTRYPNQWVEFISEYLGAEKYEALRQKAIHGPNMAP